MSGNTDRDRDGVASVVSARAVGRCAKTGIVRVPVVVHVGDIVRVARVVAGNEGRRRGRDRHVCDRGGYRHNA